MSSNRRTRRGGRANQGLTAGQKKHRHNEVAILARLVDHGRLTPTQIAEKTRIPYKAVSRTLGWLHTQKYVSRTHGGDTDERNRFYEVTETGKLYSAELGIRPAVTGDQATADTMNERTS